MWIGLVYSVTNEKEIYDFGKINYFGEYTDGTFFVGYNNQLIQYTIDKNYNIKIVGKIHIIWKVDKYYYHDCDYFLSGNDQGFYNYDKNVKDFVMLNVGSLVLYTSNDKNTKIYH